MKDSITKAKIDKDSELGKRILKALADKQDKIDNDKIIRK